MFRAVPRDRDWALTRLDGLLLRRFRGLALSLAPHLVGFEEEYPSALALTWSGRALDRHFLTVSSGVRGKESLRIFNCA